MSYWTSPLIYWCKVPLWRHSCCCCLFVPLLFLLLLDWLSVEFCPLWMLCLQLNLLCRLFRAHGGKLQASKAFLMCSISLWSACSLVETTLALYSKCWEHYVLLWSGCCPSVDIGLCVWAFCRQEWWGCCSDLEKPRYPGMVELPLSPVPPQWIVCTGPVCWYVLVVVGCVLPPG